MLHAGRERYFLISGLLLLLSACSGGSQQNFGPPPPPPPPSDATIITVPQPQGNHNGGNIAFGPDGFLYIGFGDGGGQGDPNDRAQDTTYVLGSILRLDVDSASPYAIPADNPFSSNTNCIDGIGTMSCPEIYAWGFRNPWRFSFDSLTGELWVGDVGQNAWEEIDRVELGMNYGWDDREGAHCYEPSSGCLTNNVDPITEYDHSVGSSVTGGFVYRGAALPDLQGYYLFADFGTGRIWAVPADSAQGVTPQELHDTTLSISSFAQSEDGELYVLDYGSGGIYQIISAAVDTEIQRVFSQLSFSLPVAMMQAPGDNSRWFVVEKNGVVRVFDNNSNVSSSGVFIDISAQVESGPNEAGLLGMAFHPDFSVNGQVFLSYTRAGPLTSVITRFSMGAGS